MTNRLSANDLDTAALYVGIGALQLAPGSKARADLLAIQERLISASAEALVENDYDGAIIADRRARPFGP